MRRSYSNFIIDAAGFAGFVFLAATGVLVRYVLPPGSGHNTTLWGMDRHEWGSIHFWIAVAFLAVLVLHLFYHWRWIVSVVRGRPREGSGLRLGLGVVALLAIVMIALAPFLSPIERGVERSHEGGSSESSGHGSEQVRGRTTLAEIERDTGVPATYLIERLGLPSDAPRDVGVAKLGKQHGFDIGAVRRAVGEYGSE